jgi:hypothetical protein
MAAIGARKRQILPLFVAQVFARSDDNDSVHQQWRVRRRARSMSMRTPCPGSPAIRLVGGASRCAARGAMAEACGDPCGAGELARASHRDEVRARLSSGTYDTRAAAHALAHALLACGEL